jgi:hypothetical protein
MTRRITNQDKLAMHKAICLATSVQSDLPPAFYKKPMVDCILDSMPDFDVDDPSLGAFLEISKLEFLDLEVLNAGIARTVAKSTFSKDTSWTPAIYRDEMKLLSRAVKTGGGLRHLDKFLIHMGYKTVTDSFRIIKATTPEPDIAYEEGAPKFSAGLSYTVGLNEDSTKHTYKSRYSLHSLDQLLDEVQIILGRKFKSINYMDDSGQSNVNRNCTCNSVHIYMDNKLILTFSINTKGVRILDNSLDLKESLDAVDINVKEKLFVKMLSDHSIFDGSIEPDFRRQLKNCMLENALGM